MEWNDANKKLKKKVNNLYRVIRNAEAELERVREEDCEHPEYEKCNYMWAPGHIYKDASVCTVCGKLLKTKHEMDWDETYTSSDTTSVYPGLDSDK